MFLNVRTMVTLLVAVVHIHTGHIAKHTHHHHSRPASANCAGGPYECVVSYVHQHHIGEPEGGWLIRIPGCESKYNVYAQNPSGSTGLYQFMAETWNSTPYGNHSIYSAYYQVRAADWLYKRDGGGREWVCK